MRLNMLYLFQNNGKACAAKSCFMLAFFTCLFKIAVSGITIGDIAFASADYAGIAAFLSPLAALYWGRAKTKADEK